MGSKLNLTLSPAAAVHTQAAPRTHHASPDEASAGLEHIYRLTGTENMFVDQSSVMVRVYFTVGLAQ